jgi:hypothetical protein
MARHYARGSAEGARRGYRAARAELAASVPPHAVEELLAAYRAEGYKLAAAERAVSLVEHALRDAAPPPGPGKRDRERGRGRG